MLLLSVLMLCVIYVECHNKVLYAECHYAEYCYAECRGAQFYNPFYVCNLPE